MSIQSDSEKGESLNLSEISRNMFKQLVVSAEYVHSRFTMSLATYISSNIPTANDLRLIIQHEVTRHRSGIGPTHSGCSSVRQGKKSGSEAF